MAFLQRLFVNLQTFDEENIKEICSSDYSVFYTIKANQINKDDKNDSLFFIRNDPPNTLYCAKVSKQILTKAADQEKLLHEVLVLKNVSHPSILQFKGFNLYDFKHTPHPTIITLFMNNGSLHSILNGKLKLDVTKKQICIIGVASAMCHLHRLKIAHCNLKLSNVLLDDKYYPKVCDFGLKRKYTKDDYSVDVAPEMVNSDFSKLKFEDIKSCDVYSFAILCYEIISGKVPFDGLSNSKVYQKVLNGEPLSFTGIDISQEFKNFINECYQADPKKRPSFESIYSRLIDDCSLNINDHVQAGCLSDYICSLQENTNESGKVQLEICTYEGYAQEFINEKIVEYNDKSDTETLNEIINKNFRTGQDRTSIMAFILKMYSTVSANYSTLAKTTVFANELVSKDTNAVTFIRKTFGNVQFNNIEKITPSDTGSYDKLCNINVSSKVKSIERRAFSGKENLQNINLLPTIESIKAEAFYGCKKLTFVNLNNKMTKIEKHTFEKCKDLAYVRLPDNLECIEEKAFKDCTSLKYIYIPPSVKSIEKNAFSGCKKLAKVEMSSKTKYHVKTTFPRCVGQPTFYDSK